MERPSLTTALSTVLSAAVENTDRPRLLARIHRTPAGVDDAGGNGADTAPDAVVVPLPRRSPEPSARRSGRAVRPLPPVQGAARRSGSPAHPTEPDPTPAA